MDEPSSEVKRGRDFDETRYYFDEYTARAYSKSVNKALHGAVSNGMARNNCLLLVPQRVSATNDLGLISHLKEIAVTQVGLGCP